MAFKNSYALIAASILATVSFKAESAAPLVDGCELHVWPSKIYSSYNVDVNVGYAGGGYFSVGTSLEPINGVDQILRRNLEEADQVGIVRDVIAQTGGKFKNHLVVVHPAPDGPKHGNWLAKDAGHGARDTVSRSVCYSELHILFLTYFTNTLGGKIQTTLLYRDFGRNGSTERVTKAMMNYKAGAFPANKPELVETAQRDAKSAFSKGMMKFMSKKSILK
jgi:hypothetical protein